MMSDGRLLETRGVGFSYGAVAVLQDVTLGVSAGEVVTLIGPNGSGKSTLIRACLGQLKVTGSVMWEGREVRAWSRRSLARRVAYLPQSPAYEPEQSVREVLQLGRAAYWGAFGIESAEDARVVGEVAEELALQPLLSRRMNELSGGQRQRVFVGRCLVQRPAAMLLDEPNTYLDLKHQVELGRLVKRLAGERGIGVLMASHDLNLAGAFADRLILLAGGHIVADGSVTEVLNPQTLSTVYGVPMERLDRENGKSAVVIPIV
jgi:iron complex transport system ATP-binding protein